MKHFRNGVLTDKRGIRRFDMYFRVKVLEFLDSGGREDAACMEFHITKRELKRIMWWKKRKEQVPERKELAEKSNTLRARLYNRAVDAVASSLAPIQKVIEGNPILQEPKGMDHLPTVVGHERNRGQNAIKVLEGLGDFRRGGDDIPREGPRQPLFNLPPGTHVAVRLDITTEGETNGRNIDAARESEIGTTAEGGTEGLEAEV